MNLDIPYEGYSWQVSQHAGRIEEPVVRCLLTAIAPLDGQGLDRSVVDDAILATGILTPSSERSLWRDYQQVLYEIGLVYPTTMTGDVVKVSGIAHEFLSGAISFSELLTIQLMQYQYPQGYKQTIPNEAKASILAKGETYASLVALQEHYGIKMKPLVFVWRLIDELNRMESGAGFVTTEELQRIILRSYIMDQIHDCAQAVLAFRTGESSYPFPGPSVKRNANDWVTLLCRTMLFDSVGSKIVHSNISQANLGDLRWLMESLSDEAAFWIPDDSLLSWNEEFGSSSHPIRSLIADPARDFLDVFPSLIVGDAIANIHNL